MEELFEFFYSFVENCLSCGDLVFCHRLRNFLFSMIFCLIGVAHVFVCVGMWGSGVEFQAACCIVWTRCCTLSSRSCAVFKGTCRISVSWIRVRNVAQFVRFVLRIGALGLGTSLECKLMRTGEWSKDRSKLDSALSLRAGIRCTAAKSIRSGTFLLSLGQWVGSPVETWPKLAVCMALNNSHRLGVVSREPQWQCLAL